MPYSDNRDYKHASNRQGSQDSFTMRKNGSKSSLINSNRLTMENVRLGNEYLEQIHETNKKMYSGSKNAVIVDQFLNSEKLNDYEKMQAVKHHAHQMEERARREEKLIALENQQFDSNNGSPVNNFHQRDVQKTIKVNDMYIDAI